MMTKTTLPHAQHGATLVVGLIMLVLITLMVVTAFMLSSTNLKAVGNMQFRDEAVAAANAAIETVLSTSIQETNTAVDIGGIEYQVAVAKPTCLRATLADAGVKTSLSLPKEMSSGETWNVMFDIEATVNDARSGAFVRVHQGVRALLTQAQKEAHCL